MQLEHAIEAYREATPTFSQQLILEQLMGKEVVIIESITIGEQRILQMFWHQYASYFMILLGSSVVYIILQVSGIKFIVGRMMRGVTEEVGIKREQSLVEIPVELQPLFEKVWEVESELDEVASQNEQFRSFASHELRNQLTEIQSLCYQLDVKDETLLQLIQEMKDTVANLLTMSYVPSTLVKEKVDVILTTASVVDFFQHDALHFEFAGDAVGAEIMGTENLLYRCVYNLIDNALKYRDKNTIVEVAVRQMSESTITIEIMNQSHDASFETVQGHGIGLELVEHITNILEGYYYAEVDGQQVKSILTFAIK